jgi:hypothetical protein
MMQIKHSPQAGFSVTARGQQKAPGTQACYRVGVASPSIQRRAKCAETTMCQNAIICETNRSAKSGEWPEPVHLERLLNDYGVPPPKRPRAPLCSKRVSVALNDTGGGLVFATQMFRCPRNRVNFRQTFEQQC